MDFIQFVPKVFKDFLSITYLPICSYPFIVSNIHMYMSMYVNVNIMQNMLYMHIIYNSCIFYQ